jgi:hypothetical protein
VANSDRYRRDERYGRDDRGFVDRATDEVRSWFGDDQAETRRRYEEREDRGSYRGEPPQGRAWADRGGNWDRDEVRRDQRMFPELADGRGDRGPSRREPSPYSGYDGDRGGWDAAPRAPWPEDRGETTPQHGPAGSWREWRGQHASYATHGGWHVGKGPSGYTRSD